MWPYTADFICLGPVSYTHLDVYKRQPVMIPGMADGNRMVRMVCHFPAPIPTAPCL